jgi:predicted amidohydrolase YtcJ
LDDYADRPGHRGINRYSDEEIYAAVKEARQNGFQLSVHANGDASVEQTINAYVKVLDEFPLEDNRWRIEHYQIITKEQIDKTVQYGFRPSMQFIHCTSDRTMAEKRYGLDTGRLDRAYIWRDILNAGLHIANGSDAPVEFVNPYHGFYAGVTRKGRDGQPEDGWYKEQCLTREEVLRAATIWTAEAQFEENIRGSLEPGKLADFVVIDKDLLTCDAEEIKDIQALKTIVGGKPIFERHGE